MLLGELRQQVPWGEGKLLKETLDQKVFSFLGPKTQADLQKPAKLKMKKKTDPQQSEDAHQTSKTQNQLPGSIFRIHSCAFCKNKQNKLIFSPLISSRKTLPAIRTKGGPRSRRKRLSWSRRFIPQAW
eukprot:Sdes_comp18415_c0_seq6m8294